MIGRNDPCLCGSGKKYKKCCLGKNEVPVEQLIEEELERTLLGVYEQSRDRADVAEFNGYRRQWYGKLGRLWDRQSIEVSVTEYFLFVARQDLWQRHLARVLSQPMRGIVQSVVEGWKEPFILLGKVIGEKDGFLEVKELFSEKTYLLEKSKNGTHEKETIVFGMALPDNRQHENGVYVITSFLFVQDVGQSIEQEITKFVEENDIGQDQAVYKTYMADIYRVLLTAEKPAIEEVIEVEAEESIEKVIEETIESPVEQVVEASVEAPLEEANDHDLTEIQQEVLTMIDDALTEVQAEAEASEKLKSIAVRYFSEEKPNFRKPNVVAAAVFLVAIELEMLGERAMTNAEVAKLFEVSTASIRKHAENIRTRLTKE